MTMRVAILGATGAVGRHVVPRLRERGHDVRAVVRSDAEAGALRRVGIDAVPGDIFDARTLRQAVEGCSAVLHLATAVPRPGQPPNWGLNDRIRREGTANLVAACRSVGVQRCVQQSLAFLVGGTSSLVDETAPLLPPNEVTVSAIDMERLVAESGLDWVILRDGALYGPGTGREEHWRALAPLRQTSGSRRRLGLYLADPCCRFGGSLRSSRGTRSFRRGHVCGRRPADDLSGALRLYRGLGGRPGPDRRWRIQLSIVPDLECQGPKNPGMATMLPLLQIRTRMTSCLSASPA